MRWSTRAAGCPGYGSCPGPRAAAAPRAAPERRECGMGRLVAAPHDLRPAAAVEEQVVEVEARHLVQVDRLDQRQPVAQAPLAAARELDVARPSELAARLDHPADA